jgi:cytochrome c556
MRSLAPLAAAILIGTTAFVANAGVVEDRKANFKANNASMRAIGAAIGGGDFETVTREAERIAAWAMVMPDYFPEGSGEGTSAKPAIWTDFIGFKDAAEANYYAAQELIAAAAKQDADAAGEALRAIGGTCKGCHQKFKSW